MGKNKPRSYKNQFKFGEVLYQNQHNCPNYERSKDGSEWCHGEYSPHTAYGKRVDQNSKLICKGNRFNCLKQKYRWWASLGQKIKNKYLRIWEK